MEQFKQKWQRVPKSIRRPLVSVAGSIVIIVGIILMPLPGPGWAIVFVGLAILATEFERPKRIRDWLIKRFKSAWEAAKAKSSGNIQTHDSKSPKK